jgi:hypothetical protein
MTVLSADVVARRLDLPDQLAPWLGALEQAGPPAGGVPLPGGDEAVELLRRLGVVEPDLAAIVGSLPSPERQPELWWLLERAHELLRRDIGRPEAATWLPSLPSDLGARGRCFWVYVFLATAGAVHAWHSERGIAADVSWSTLADLGRHVSRYRRRNAVTGLDSQFWIGLHFRGGLYELGRLQFNPYRLRTGMAGPLFWYEGEAAAALGAGFQPGDPALGVHVPAGSPLDPAACDESFRTARTFFRRHFPDHACRVATCTSWLLDEQLADHLPSTSNIVRFQRRFELVPGARQDDAEPFRFVFDRAPESLDELSPETELERALVRHVRAGGHWHLRTGWLEL